MKQEVRRGRKFVEYHDPETQPEGTFTQEISGADVSYQDETGNWHPADENWQTDGLDGFILKNDKLNHKVRLKGTGGRTWYPRRNVTSEYMTFGVPQYWNGKRWANFGFSGWSVEGKTITLNTRENVTILVHNRWNGIKIDWVLASSSAPSRMRYPVSLTGITYVDGIIYGADGTRLGQLTPTTATDSTFDEMGEPTQLPCSGSFAGGYVEFQADVTGASFPVTIDPDFSVVPIDVAIVSISTISYAYNRDTQIPNDPDMGATKEWMYPGFSQHKDGAQFRTGRYFCKFDTSSIGSGGTVTQVNMKLSDNYGNRTVGVYVVPYDWSSNDPITTTNKTAVYRGLTGVSGEQGFTGIPQTSSNLSTAIINKSGYTYLGIISAKDYAQTEDVETLVYLCMSSHATTSKRPVLTVTYTEASGALRRTNMNAQMQSLTGGFN